MLYIMFTIQCVDIWTSNANDRYLYDVFVGPALLWIAVFSILQKYFVHIGTGILEQLVCTVEDDQRDFAVAEDAQLVRFLHQAKLTLCKRNLQIKIKTG